ncbi:MAG: hypothetical protein ACUVQV_08640 [Dissulfurimicrobium sp.]|uniref:hypothetical protein n=1 Tax=Dissulfurimicrobium sp. TaxID=2022436 RepID=UPI00404B5F01
MYKISLSQKNSASHAIIEKKDIMVGQANGPDSYTISEIYGAKVSLDGKHATVKGVVVKVSTGIMGKTGYICRTVQGVKKRLILTLL